MSNNKTAVSSKLVKTRVVLRDRKLSKHVPKTYRLTRSRLLSMLNRYGMVYVKPDTGSLGVGVMRVEKRGKSYRYHSGLNKHTFSAFRGMYASLQQHTGKRLYLVQKGIHVLRYKGRPVDFRVMIQKSPSRCWEPTGTVARVAHPRKAVTNGSQGGTIYPAADMIRPVGGSAQSRRILKHMDRLAVRTAAQFGRAYPAMNELGLDIALDRKLTPWILEVNTRPDPCPFTKLTNKRSITKIVAYGKAYGRRYCLNCSKAKRAPKA
ncbi:hypothetical protein SY83_09680 [Paenibacillus swuensis]|uniref:ATP-grasp domain-containing protein n=1 Tax=Paenibacillus swuensis TaxID=1178515 RepID=A0A172TI89_9BACL|nr:YheC/YheD family protein [Paenibacillus swuensis]ANE46503.1 hypothetical protein SY83_09680 [Paenibacillus swuensis]